MLMCVDTATVMVPVDVQLTTPQVDSLTKL